MAKKWIEEARKACDGNCAYCEYYWQEWDDSGCKLDDFESEDAEEMSNIDEMKNKISLELKNPVTQQGFEIICKKLVNADCIIRDLLSLLVTFQEQIVFDDDKQKIKKAEEFLGL